MHDLAKRVDTQINVVDTAPSPASGALAALTAQAGGGTWCRAEVGDRRTRRNSLRTPQRRAEPTAPS